MTGGYLDQRYSRLATIQRIKDLRDKRQETERKRREEKTRMQGQENKINSILGEMQQLEREKLRKRDELDSFLLVISHTPFFFFNSLNMFFISRRLVLPLENF